VEESEKPDHNIYMLMMIGGEGGKQMKLVLKNMGFE
jgi:hypothetical protein